MEDGRDLGAVRDAVREAKYVRLAVEFAALVQESQPDGLRPVHYAELGRRLMLWAREAAK